MSPPVRKPTVPPREPSDEFDDEHTPISGDPFVSLEWRSKLTRKDAKEALDTVRLVHENVQGMDRKLTQYVEIDQREHQNLRDDNKRTEEALDRVDKRMTEVEKNLVANNTKLDQVLDHLQAQRRVEEHKTKVTIETQAHVERIKADDEVDENKAKRKRGLSILSIVGGLLGSGGIVATIIAAALGKC